MGYWHRRCSIGLMVLACGMASAEPTTLVEVGVRGPFYTNYPWGISDNGLVAGWVDREFPQLIAWRWAPGTGTVTIASIPGYFGAMPLAVSENGLVVAGTTDTRASFTPLSNHAWRSIGGGPVADITPSVDWEAAASAVSSDGSVIAGWFALTRGGARRLFRFGGAGWQDLGSYPGMT